MILLLSGPSCVGKTPLLQSFKKQNPYKKIGAPVFFTSRQARRVETEGVDYFFRSEREIRSLAPDRYIIAQTRHIWQAIDVEEMFFLAGEYKLVIYDIHPELVKRIFAHDKIMSTLKNRLVRVFLQPARIDEIRADKEAAGKATLQETTAAIMTAKLVSRAQQQGDELTPDVLQDIHIRAGRAWEEILGGQEYDHIIINYDGEDSPNWRCSPPTGNAGETLKRFTEIIQKHRN